jgi:hypothetical protein
MSTVETPPAFVDDDSWAQPRHSASRGWKVLATGLALSAVSLTVFGAGVKFGKSGSTTTANQFGGRGGFPGAGNGGTGPTRDQLAQVFGQGATTSAPGVAAAVDKAPKVLQGKVTALDATTITLQLTDGTPVTVKFDGDTRIGRRSLADASALLVGSVIEITQSNDAATATEIVTGDLVDRTTTKTSKSLAETVPTTADPGLGGLLPTG